MDDVVTSYEFPGIYCPDQPPWIEDGIGLQLECIRVFSRGFEAVVRVHEGEGRSLLGRTRLLNVDAYSASHCVKGEGDAIGEQNGSVSTSRSGLIDFYFDRVPQRCGRISISRSGKHLVAFDLDQDAWGKAVGRRQAL